MSGQGSRFIKAGYTTYKPLILQNDMPVIQHVVNMFPGEDDLIFIVRTDLLETIAKRYNVPPKFVLAIAKAESEMGPHRISRTGAMGMMQLMPLTAQDLKVSNP